MPCHYLLLSRICKFMPCPYLLLSRICKFMPCPYLLLSRICKFMPCPYSPILRVEDIPKVDNERRPGEDGRLFYVETNCQFWRTSTDNLIFCRFRMDFDKTPLVSLLILFAFVINAKTRESALEAVKVSQFLATKAKYVANFKAQKASTMHNDSCRKYLKYSYSKTGNGVKNKPRFF